MRCGCGEAMLPPPDAECSICLCGDDKSDMVRACECSGTIAWKHQRCLREQVLHRLGTHGRKRALECPVCRVNLRLEVEAVGNGWEGWWTLQSAIELAYIVSAAVFLMYAVSVAFYALTNCLVQEAGGISLLGLGLPNGIQVMLGNDLLLVVLQLATSVALGNSNSVLPKLERMALTCSTESARTASRVTFPECVPVWVAVSAVCLAVILTFRRLATAFRGRKTQPESLVFVPYSPRAQPVGPQTCVPVVIGESPHRPPACRGGC